MKKITTSKQLHTTPEIRREIIRRHDKGDTNASIARVVGFSKQTIANILKGYAKHGAEYCEKTFYSNSGRSKLPTLTADDIQHLENILPNKSAYQMKFTEGSKNVGMWTAHEVRDLILNKTGKKIALGSCIDIIRKLGLVPIQNHPYTTSGGVYSHWQKWITEDFLSWKDSHPSLSTLQQREDLAVKQARERGLKSRKGAPTLAQRKYLSVKYKYLLNDHLLTSPDELTVHLDTLAQSE